jgi:HAD superfamily hydrolase (TIGR01509 family)
MIRACPAAILFDMDGLLLDTERLIRDTMAAAMADWGLVLRNDQFARLIGLPERDCKAIMADMFGAELDYDLLRAATARRIAAEHGPVRPLKPGARALVQQVEAAGIACALVSSTERRLIESHLHHAGLLGHFRAIVAGDEVSAGKPDPEPYRMAAAQLGLPPQSCLALEDSHNGVRSAHAAGVPVIMVPDLLPATPAIRALALAVAPDLAMVADWLSAAAGRNRAR